MASSLDTGVEWAYFSETDRNSSEKKITRIIFFYLMSTYVKTDDLHLHVISYLAFLSQKVS